MVPTLEALTRAIDIYRRDVPTYSLLTFELFLMIASRHPISPGELARKLNIAQGVVTGAVNNIAEDSPGYRRAAPEAAVLVSRVVSPEDARQRLYGLTSKGGQLAAEMLAAIDHRGQASSANTIRISGEFKCDS